MDLERIERLVRLFERSHARELHVESEGWSLSLSRASVAAVSTAAPAEAPRAQPAEEAEQPTTRVSITAPLVGIFRQGGVRLQVGDRVEAGAPVGSIESMKILSPVLADEGGEIQEVLVEDGQPVEYGHQLYLLQPHHPLRGYPGRESDEAEP